MRQGLNFCFVALFAAGAQVAAQDGLLVEFRGLFPDDLEAQGFTLQEDQKIQIEAVGAGGSRDELIANAWILNSQTREVVWELAEANTRRSSHDLVEANEAVSLAKGSYEAYYSYFPYYHFSDRHDGFRGFSEFAGYLWNELFEKDYSHNKSAHRDLRLVIRGKGERLGKEELERIQKRLGEDAIVSLNAVWDDRYERRGFILEQPMDLHVYAFGEAVRDDVYDYGWIINTKTREKVWNLNYRDSEPGGGARKNRMVNTALSLPAGSYAAFFVTDDSHSHGRWNSPPPYDPTYWGLTIRAKDPAKRQYAKTFDYEEAPEKNVIVELTRMRDDDMRSMGFALKRPMSVRVYALGEGRGGEMFDYGWIVDAKTHKKIWEMKYSQTEHAGGASKNRLFDGSVKLDKGSYIAYFVTDDSHCFMDWNSSRPYDAEHWGLTILGEDADFKPDDVGAYEEEADKSVLARLVNMRDDERRHATFKLDRDGTIRIYAIGEGRDDEMFDYGWIEEARTGKVAWEMTYRMTEHAGGGRKNRIFADTISLKAGDYKVFYESDGSHSFNDWNDDPPYDPFNWGITVYAAED